MTGSAILGVLTHTAGHATCVKSQFIYIIYAHELQLVDMGGEHNEEAVQQEDLCYHAHAMVQQCGTMAQQCHYSTQVEQ